MSDTHRSLVATVFCGGDIGPWIVERNVAVYGAPLTAVSRVLVADEPVSASGDVSTWMLRGVASYARYTHRAERDALRAVQPSLGRPDSTRAVLIPIRKSSAWWDLAQDERRSILEEQSAHIRLGMRVLPSIARRLYQCRDLGEEFDFLTWFEFADADAVAFDTLLEEMRRTEEWNFVDREVEIRLRRASDESSAVHPRTEPIHFGS